MTSVDTVRGPLDTGRLGRVLMHEHVFVLGEEIRTNFPDYPSPWDEDERVDDAVAKLKALSERGIDTIVDPTVVGLGRYIPRIQRVAERVDISIVVATGLYTYNDLPFQFHNVGPGLLVDGPEPLTELFVKDIREGIAGTGVRAGMLKCAIEIPGLTPGVERVMRAVGQAHVETGVPITVHTNPHTGSGQVAQRVLAEEGVDLTKVVIGHSGDSTDLDYLRRIADAGSILGMDRFGLDLLLPFEQRVDTVVALVEAGYTERMVLSHDASCFIDWFPHDVKQTAVPNWNYNHISDEVLPALRERGVTDEQITTMLVDNPRRIFER
ncbi:phosphotriesterase [Rhodococcus pyridinivorans]|uniref:Phosphotriesterase n=3 Tax=Rhodococcus pyridinivorans TaxID=103816 RepID=V9XL46_9NOCA|nr:MULTISPECIES: phosphotriesterase [Rhodococcus]AHD22700.1 phosphotriesterase [Rhodococcus pyridinivorans SB3094]AOD21815.1 phosphotriesterase [Rhodococcus sp. p52]APE11902.1 phosphotriesterase-related protein [Rhodococcus sp. 2G]AWZ23814.1 phosphotriesterase [Rhodococcus pyridinivorans]EHK84065.1 N-acylhomoserine lactonase [Rhodococcus pyridinivorans AK37]